MPIAFLILAGCELLGEAIRTAAHLPLPGPVIGMFVLALVLRHDGPQIARTRAQILTMVKPTSEGLIANMGLLFVPAGVGVIGQVGMISREWLPIAVAVIGSTIVSLIVTGLAHLIHGIEYFAWIFPFLWFGRAGSHRVEAVSF